MMRTHQNRLCLIVADTADAERAVHCVEILIKLCSERSIFNIMNCLVKTVFFVINAQACAASA